MQLSLRPLRRIELCMNVPTGRNRDCTNSLNYQWQWSRRLLDDDNTAHTYCTLSRKKYNVKGWYRSDIHTHSTSRWRHFKTCRLIANASFTLSECICWRTKIPIRPFILGSPGTVFDAIWLDWVQTRHFHTWDLVIIRSSPTGRNFFVAVKIFDIGNLMLIVEKLKGETVFMPHSPLASLLSIGTWELNLFNECKRCMWIDPYEASGTWRADSRVKVWLCVCCSNQKRNVNTPLD